MKPQIFITLNKSFLFSIRNGVRKDIKMKHGLELYYTYQTP
jgi:hypothetical protein